MWVTWGKNPASGGSRPAPGSDIAVLDSTDGVRWQLRKANAVVGGRAYPFHGVGGQVDEQLEVFTAAWASDKNRWYGYFQRAPGFPQPCPGRYVFVNWGKYGSRLKEPRGTPGPIALPLGERGPTSPPRGKDPYFFSGSPRYKEIWLAVTSDPRGISDWIEYQGVFPPMAPRADKRVPVLTPDPARFWWQGFFLRPQPGTPKFVEAWGGLSEPSVLYERDPGTGRNRFVMYFESDTIIGVRAPDWFLDKYRKQRYKVIGRATSGNGYDWVVDPDPVLLPAEQTEGYRGQPPVYPEPEDAEWDDQEVTMPSVVKDPLGGYHMFYVGVGLGKPPGATYKVIKKIHAAGDRPCVLAGR